MKIAGIDRHTADPEGGDDPASASEVDFVSSGSGYFSAYLWGYYDTVDDVDVFIDGVGPQTVVMVHGWPDTPALWDGTVAALVPDWRCVRFHLPGFDLARGPRPMSQSDIVALIARARARRSSHGRGCWRADPPLAWPAHRSANRRVRSQ